MALKLDHERLNRLEKAKFKPPKETESPKDGSSPKIERKPTAEDLNKAQHAWKHFMACGDLGPAQRLSDSLPRELRYKFLRWLLNTAPIFYRLDEKRKLRLFKDRERANSRESFNDEEAVNTAFWEYFAK